MSKFHTGPDNIQEKYAKGLNERNKSDKLNPILPGGGPLWPVRPKIVCRFLVDCARLAKFLDFVSFNVLQVSEGSFFEKKFFGKKYRTLSKISIGGTLLCENQNFQNFFFFENAIFSASI